MYTNIEYLAEQVKIHREHIGWSQNKLVEEIDRNGKTKANRTNIAHLEQARKLPYDPEILKSICETLNMPRAIWESFLNKDSILRSNFEVVLQELVGEPISAFNLDTSVINVVETQISVLFNNKQPEHSYDIFNSIIIFYGIRPVRFEFFSKYFKSGAFRSIDNFQESVHNYLKEAIRVFSTISEAYNKLNNKHFNLIEMLAPLAAHDLISYNERSAWDRIQNIPESELPFLGYIAAQRVKKEQTERDELASFLKQIAAEIRNGNSGEIKHGEKKKRKMDSLLRKFNSKIEHGLFSPLFSPDPDSLEKEANFIAPTGENDIQKMEETQRKAYNNLANYLTADYMDVYVATSMRSDADFISVNQFVESLFGNPELADLKLRYFNPTQSWIEDRVAKGLVEALMLKRANVCIYMAQKEDTFGKDSEASVTLGQGKPVIIYVPKLYSLDGEIDSELYGFMDKTQLINEIKKIDKAAIDESDEGDNESLNSKLIELKLKNLTDIQVIEICKSHWADFDLYGESENRIKSNSKDLIEFKETLNDIIKNKKTIHKLSDKFKENLISIFISSTIRFERRAKIFREVHPLALQVILSSGVLNGIIVVRSINSCAQLLRNLIENKLELILDIDEYNYRLVEKHTKSTIRVISRHKLIANAFSTFYKENM